MIARGLGLVLRVARAEGLCSLATRTLDRLADLVWLWSSRHVPLSTWLGDPTPVDRLYVLPFMLARGRGGVAHHLANRLNEECRTKAVALLVRQGRCFILLGWPRPGGPARRTSWRAPVAEEAQSLAGWRDALERATQLCPPLRTRFESVAGLPLGLLDAAHGALELAAHDYALFCPRVHPVEVPTGLFCGLPREAAVCVRCLGADRNTSAVEIDGERAHAGRLLALAERVEFPSEEARHVHLSLFPTLAADRTEVRAPGRYTTGKTISCRVPSSPPRRIALVGAVHRHKGAAIFSEVVQLVRARRPAWPGTWHVLGGGDPELLTAIRALGGIRIHGYYRAGSLPARLCKHEIDLALLLSPWPETYCLAVDECAAAGVPIVAFDLGASGARIKQACLGEVVPVESGAEGIADCIIAKYELTTGGDPLRWAVDGLESSERECEGSGAPQGLQRPFGPTGTRRAGERAG